MDTLQVDIVSAEEEIFSGAVDHVTAMGEVGELGVHPGHTPLLTHLKPGEIRLAHNGTEDIYYVSGGVLEVQPHLVTVLADTITRASDLDEVAAVEAKKRAEKALKDKKSDLDFNAASAELAQAMAQLRAISRLKDRL